MITLFSSFDDTRHSCDPGASWDKLEKRLRGMISLKSKQLLSSALKVADILLMG